MFTGLQKQTGGTIQNEHSECLFLLRMDYLSERTSSVAYASRGQKAVTSDKGKRGHHAKMAKLTLRMCTPDFPEGTNICRSPSHKNILGTDEVDNEMMASEVPVRSYKETFPNHSY